MYRTKGEIKKLLIEESKSLRATITKLNTAGRSIIFIVDKFQKLVGTMTDGDIRRQVLDGMDLSVSVKDVMSNSPVFIEANDLKDTNVHDLMLEKRIKHVPVITDGIIRDIIFHSDILDFFPDDSKKPHLNLPVVIMAGGKGTRLDPFTRILPKPLIPLGDEPVVKVIMDEFGSYGIKEFYLTLNDRGKMIKAYFHDHDLSYNLKYIEEEKPLGTAGSLRFLKDKLEQTFLVSNCDIIIKADLAEIVQFHKEKGYSMTLVGAMQHQTIPYGVCKINVGGDLHSISEKPQYDYITNTGFYILEPELLELIPGDTYFDMTDLIQKVLENTLKIGVFPIASESWIDVGQWKDYNKIIEKY